MGEQAVVGPRVAEARGDREDEAAVLPVALPVGATLTPWLDRNCEAAADGVKVVLPVSETTLAWAPAAPTSISAADAASAASILLVLSLHGRQNKAASQ